MTIDILALARECGAYVTMPNQAWFGADKGPLSLFTEPQLLAFTAAIIERCAVACDVIDDQYDNGAGYPAQRCANALRAMKVSAP